MKVLNRDIDLGLLLLRIGIGVMMLFHGISKLLNGVGGVEQMLETSGLPTFLAYGVFIGEIIAPLFIIFGIGTRIAALVFAVNMIVAVIMAHSGDILSLNITGGWAIELPALYFFGALTLVFTGGGKYALSRKKIWD